MKDKTITDKLKNIEIQKFKVQGLDLIITKPDGSIENIKNGLSEVILGNMTLSTEQGAILSQDEILSSITLNVGADAVYIKEQLTSDIVEYADNQASKNKSKQIDDDEQQDDKQNFSKKLAELNQKNQQLEKTLQTLSSEKDEKEVLLSSSLTKLAEAKKQLNQKSKVEKVPVEDSDLTFSPPSAPVAMPTSSSSSSTQSANKPSATPQIAKPMAQVFIQGKLSEESDSGKKGDNITNINTPTFMGVVSLDSQAYLTINDHKYPITADKDGKWSLKITEPLEDKIYEYSLVASSGDGKPVTVSGQFEVDTQFDDLSVNLDGHSNIETTGERLTNKQVPTFAGKAEVGSSVTLTISGQTLSTIADDKGVWRITVEKPLVDGVLAYQVTAVDTAGNQKTITESVTIKTSKPDASVLLDNSAVFLTNKVKPTLTGKTDPNSNIIVKVAGKEYLTKANEQGDWSLTITDNLADGSHVLNVTVTDNVGNQGIFIQSLLVDTTPPAAQAALTESSDSGLKGDHITQQQAVTLAGSTKPQSTVVLQFSGQEYSTIADKDGQWQITLPAVDKDGKYDYQVSVTDTIGNVGTSNGHFTVDTQVDSLSVQLDTQSDSGNIGDNITNETRPHFSGKAEAGSRIVLTIDGQLLNTTADSHGEWSVVAQNILADGVYDYEVKATDVAGNSAVVTASVQIKTTLHPTTLQLNNQSDFITSQLTPTLSGRSEANAKISIAIDGKTYSTQADSQGNWLVLITSPLTLGSHSLKVQVTDIAEFGLDVSTNSGTLNDAVTNHSRPKFNGLTEPNALVEFTINKKTYQESTSEKGEWTVSMTEALSDGTHNYRIEVKDKAGNSTVKTGQVIIDSKAPELTGQLDESTNTGDKQDEITNINTPKFSGITEPDTKVFLTIDNHTYKQTTNGQGQWEITVANPLNDGAHPYEINVYDQAGNQAQLKGSIVIDSSLPDATVTPAPVDNTGGNHVDIPSIDTTMLPIDIDNHYF